MQPVSRKEFAQIIVYIESLSAVRTLFERRAVSDIKFCIFKILNVYFWPGRVFNDFAVCKWPVETVVWGLSIVLLKLSTLGTKLALTAHCEEIYLKQLDHCVIIHQTMGRKEGGEEEEEEGGGGGGGEGGGGGGEGGRGGGEDVPMVTFLLFAFMGFFSFRNNLFP